MEIVYNGIYGKKKKRVGKKTKIQFAQDQKTAGHKARDAGQKTPAQIVPIVNRQDFKKQYLQNYYLFDPASYGRVYAFVDFANVRKWAKSFWLKENQKYLVREIDISKVGEVIDFISPAKKFFYYGHYREYIDLDSNHPLNIKHRKSIYRISRARDARFTVRSKAVKEISDFDEFGAYQGKINKCNFDIEIAMDMLQKIDKYDTVFLWSGDSDFHILLQYLKSKNKKVITICVRDFVSEELHKHSDLYIPADPLADYLEYMKV